MDTPRGLAPLHPGTKPKPTEVRKDIIQTDVRRPGKPDVRLSSETAATLAAEASAAEAALSEPSLSIPPCSTCGSTTLPARYTSLKSHGAFAVCPPCYAEGRFPSSLHSGDFVKLSTGPYAHAEKDPWTDQETLLLLEGLEMHEEDWDKVAEHVATRTKDQCIVKFLQLPIEDPFLEATQTDLGPLQYARMPFSQNDNPILSVMAFLAATVDKDVAAAAAGQSIEELEKGLRKAVVAAKANGANGKDKEVAGEGDEMEVDDVAAGETKEEGEKDAKEESDDAPSGTSKARNNIEKAATVALGAAAAKAHVLALEEDSTLHALVTSVIEAQVRKLELKMAHFDQLESLVEVERRAVEQGKQQLYEDRLKVSRVMLEVQSLHARAKAGLAQAAAIPPQELGHMMLGSGALQRPVLVPTPGPAPVVPEGQTVNLG